MVYCAITIYSSLKKDFFFFSELSLICYYLFLLAIISYIGFGIRVNRISFARLLQLFLNNVDHKKVN